MAVEIKAVTKNTLPLDCKRSSNPSTLTLLSPLKLNIDSVKHKTKPTGREMGALSNRLKRKETVALVTDIAAVLEAVCQGKTITAGEMADTKENGWRSQRLFIFDIDNDAVSLQKLKPPDVRDLLESNGLPISFVYWTFSSTPEHPKFRIAMLCDEVVTDPGEAKQIISGIMGLFPTARETDENGKVRITSQIDLSCKNLDRMFLGTNKGIVEGIGSTATFKKDVALSLYLDKKGLKKNKPTMPAKLPIPSLPGVFDLDCAIKEFDLLGYILETTNSRQVRSGSGRVLLNPCPVCGHNDDFSVYTETNSFNCFSKSNGSGGNIINYLQEKNGISKKAAVEMFKYAICGIDKAAERREWNERRKTSIKTLQLKEKTHLLAADGAIEENVTGESNVYVTNDTTVRSAGQDYFSIHFLPNEPGFIPINPFDTPESRNLYSWDDPGVSRLFADCYKNISRYVPETKMWYVYDGRVWHPDIGGVKVAGQAKKFCNYLLMTCTRLIEDDDRRSAWIDFVVKRKRKYSRDTMIADAISVWPVYIKDFDKDPYLFNCQNGTMDLRTFTIHKHNPDDFLSKISGVVYDERAHCPRWELFIGEIMQGDAETARFLQKALGYTLAGDTSEECFFILYGSTTRNGKGTTMETALHLMGDYGSTSQPETVAQKKNSHSGAPTEDIARLKGARFVNMSEPDKGLRLNSALVKQMTGGDTITARFLHQNSFEFRPEYKLFINTNHLPRVSDDSIFASRRVKLIPFERHFAESEQDKSLKTFFMQPGSISGIFNWFLEGLRLMRAEGLEQPPAVRAATDQYREESDTIGLFIRDCLQKCANNKIKTKDVYTNYENWCDENGFRPRNLSGLIEELRKKGMIKRDMKLGNIVYGYILNSENPFLE